jgi:deazaflavin-dependent oxidoreductase (nitroreductase family)
MARILPPLDGLAHRVSGGRWLLASAAGPTLLLHVGTAAPVPLLYAEDGDDLLIAATNWGRPDHPRWSTRLMQAASARVELGRRSIEVAVRLLTAAERAIAWPALLEVYPPFETYRERSGREIRVFRLTPR